MLHIKKISIVVFIQKTDMSDSKSFIAPAQNKEKFFKLDFSESKHSESKNLLPHYVCSFSFVF